MDPLSVAGVALGAVSLAIQVFDGCVQGFNFLVAAVKMPETCAALRLRLIMEYNNLLVWGKVAGLIENEEGSKISSILEMVQVRGSVSELKSLMIAAVLLGSQDVEKNPSGARYQQRNDQILRELARLKNLNAPLSQNGENPNSTCIKAEQLKYLHKNSFQAWTKATYVEPGCSPRRVWIEWKQYTMEHVQGDDSHDLKIHPNTLRRTAELAALLAAPKPDDFCTPHCFGYFDDSTSRRFGWVFEMPGNVTENAEPRSLLWLFANMPRPSLTDRIALASRIAACVLYLHAVNWIHKALRSENIIFFLGQNEFELAVPIVSGFEYSRPDNEETLECSKPKPQWDLYRWPDIQREEPQEKNSRKTYDIYGLGLILLEIANWKSLGEIMGFGDVTKLPRKESLGIRSKLLDPDSPYLAQVLETVGKKYHAVVRRCIQGHEGFGIEENDDERSTETGLKLQREYTKEVVHKLKSIEL